MLATGAQLVGNLLRDKVGAIAWIWFVPQSSCAEGVVLSIMVVTNGGTFKRCSLMGHDEVIGGSTLRRD